jgi:hypothetical protein
MLVVPLALFALWSPSTHAALLTCLLLNIPMMFYLAPTVTLVQDLVGTNMRATMASIFFLIQMLLGGVIGNQLVGILSDFLTVLTGNSALALRCSMTLGSMVALWAAAHFWRAGRFVREDLGMAGGTAKTPHSLEQADIPV